MANNLTYSSITDAIPSDVFLFLIVFKFFALIIGLLGNVTVIIYTIFLSKEKTATSYLIGNLALTDLLVCSTFYPLWIIEFIQTFLNIDSDQELFCKFSRSTIWSLLFASVATLLAITVDRYLFIVKPLKYPLIVTRQRVLLAIAGIWITTCCLYTVFHVHYKRFDNRIRSLCSIPNRVHYSIEVLFLHVPLISIFLLNFRILNVSRKQRKKICDESMVAGFYNDNERSGNMRVVFRLFHALKEVKTFSIVIIVLAICCYLPTIIGAVLNNYCSDSCQMIWYVVVQYDSYGINSIVNAFIYGMRHMKYRKAYGHILLKILRCDCGCQCYKNLL